MKRTQLSLALLVLAGLTLAVQGCGGVKKAKAGAGGGEAAATDAAGADKNGAGAGEGDKKVKEEGGGVALFNLKGAFQEDVSVYGCGIGSGKVHVWVDDKEGKVWIETGKPESFSVGSPVGENHGIVGDWDINTTVEKDQTITGDAFYKSLLGLAPVSKILVSFAKEENSDKGQVMLKVTMKTAEDSEARECAVTSEAEFKAIELKSEQQKAKEAWELLVKGADSGELKFPVPAK